MSTLAEQLYEQVEKEYDLPVADKSFNNLFIFNDLKIILDWLVDN